MQDLRLPGGSRGLQDLKEFCSLTDLSLKVTLESLEPYLPDDLTYYLATEFLLSKLPNSKALYKPGSFQTVLCTDDWYGDLIIHLLCDQRRLKEAEEEGKDLLTNSKPPRGFKRLTPVKSIRRNTRSVTLQVTLTKWLKG